MSDAASHFLSQLGRFERRLVLVAFVRYSPATVAIPALAAIGAVRLGWLSFVAATAVLLAGIAAASWVAVFVARWRVGSLVQTAAALDARFGLSNRLATALQFSGGHDAVSTLIVADASVALSRRQPRDLQFEAPRHRGWVAAGAVAVALGLALISRRPNGSGDTDVSEAVLNSAAGASASANSRPAVASANRVATAGGDSAQSTAAVGDRQPSASQSSSAARQSDPMPRREAGDRTGSSTPGEQRLDATTRAESNSVPGSSGRAGNTAARPAGVQAATASGVVAQASSSKTTLGGGISSADPRGTTTRAGGVRGALPLDSRVIEKQHEPEASSNVTPGAAWDRAETALAREHLPLEWRSYVRDYLIAIRPGRQP